MIGFVGKKLISQRLEFRVLEECDKPWLSQIIQEPETTLPAGFSPVVGDSAFEAFGADLTRYNTGIAIVLDGKCIGYYHVHPWNPNEPAYRDKKNVMIGFLIGKNYLRHGYGEETLRTLNNYLLEQFDCVWGDYFEGNTASQKLLQKCGFIPISAYDMCFDALDGKSMHVYSNVLTR